MTKYSKVLDTPIGKITLIANENAITEVIFGAEKNKGESNSVLKEAEKQLQEYFSGKRQKFDLKLEPKGTEFQQSAWTQLSKIPYGKTVSYQEQAEKIGDSKKARAVGAANGKNPLAIIVPCHRVIGKNGKLTGFAGGLDVKQKLLELEQKFCA